MNLYPEGWNARLVALNNGEAQPRDYEEAARWALSLCEHGRRRGGYCSICAMHHEPRWVPVFRGGVCVRMEWYDPKVERVDA